MLCVWWQLTCLVLPHEHYNLLQPRSIWSADNSSAACSLVEQILHLEPLEVFTYIFWSLCFFHKACSCLLLFPLLQKIHVHRLHFDCLWQFQCMLSLPYVLTLEFMLPWYCMYPSSIVSFVAENIWTLFTLVAYCDLNVLDQSRNKINDGICRDMNDIDRLICFFHFNCILQPYLCFYLYFINLRDALM